eukprot:TRINITY_DN17380_c0_g1_i1.p1 TRINITY_DN17380_c0_g1~~TRINITY_DN17380_c0_g1_i1.p1  ORF type:complete len:367 (+),score=68.82 TRINITY_DN17380_c0_g1_i1:47-1147(+)
MKKILSACTKRIRQGLDFQFASDNTTACHGDVLEAMQLVNDVPTPPYGECEITKTASDMVRLSLGLEQEDAHVRFVTSGTGGNVLCLSMACSRPYHSIVVSKCAHVATYTVGACENIIGCKVNIIPNDKITASQLRNLLESCSVYPEYSSIPKVVSITQPTEYGEVYSLDELREIKEVAQNFELFIHIDGARLPNACVALGKQSGMHPSQVLKEIGQIADLITFGGAKNGLGVAEAVVIKKHVCSSYVEVKAAMKQIGLVVSKCRFLSSQFIAYLADDLWLKNAEGSHAAASTLFNMLRDGKVSDAKPPVTNQLFVNVTKAQLESLQSKFAVYPWGDETDKGEIPIRIVTSWNTTDESCRELANLL